MWHDPAVQLHRLREAMDAAGLDGALITRPQHIFWLTGVAPAGPALLAAGRTTVCVLPGAQADLPLPPGVDRLAYRDYDIQDPPDVGVEFTAAARAAAERALHGGSRVGVEADHLPFRLVGLAPEAVDLGPLLARLRLVKTPDEVAAIRHAQAVVDAALAAVAGSVRPGVSELELWAAAVAAAGAAHGAPVALEGCLGGGARTDNPDCQPTLACLHCGDHVLVDLYPCVGGYYGDATRIYATAPLSRRQREVHSILAEALAAAEALLRPGILAAEVDRAARRVVAEAGHGDRFPHHTGHGYGLFQQERPLLVPGDATQLRAGMVITLEPGIYIPGWGGMRLEGAYLITPTGADRIDAAPFL